MKEKLLDLLNNAYAPYSKFPVSCIIVMEDGKEFGGVNVEDASTRAGICAERNAITTAVTNGYKKGDFKELHVMTTGEISTCCFVCRQLIVEFFEAGDLVYCHNTEGEVETFTVRELCPLPFDGSDLE